MAWFREMGVAEVAYHQETVLGRADDHPGRALDYYGTRGETPLRWGGAGAARLSLTGDVTPEAYEAGFGVGGFRHGGARVVATRRPGFELVVAAHKTVAILGVLGQADAMHQILDAETAGTMGWLDAQFQASGGRRGRAQQRTATGGLVYATTRHGTSRAGDPAPHDHVLVANVVEMLDDKAGFKALDSAALRDWAEAATMVGRFHAAHRAVALGYTIEPDSGPTGRLRAWKVTGVPDHVCQVFSKRTDEIAEHLEATGRTGYRARSIAARATRSMKRHTGVDQLLPDWHAQAAAAGWPVERIAASVDAARPAAPALPFPLTDAELDAVAAQVLDVDGPLLRNRKAFTRANLIAELAPLLYGQDPADLDRALTRTLSSSLVVPLIGTSGREQTYTTIAVLENEHTIAAALDRIADRPGPVIDADDLTAALTAKETQVGHPLTGGQRAAIEAICDSTSALTVVIGVAGAGKTTALDAATTSLNCAGYQPLGTSTSGQAARTLGQAAGIESNTLASLLGRLERQPALLHERSVVIVDEGSMADDADLARLTLAVDRAHARLVIVGDHRQLGAVGPGGALAALLTRRPDLAVHLTDNVRQQDLLERAALAEIRDGDLIKGLTWFHEAGRIHTRPDRTHALVATVKAWAADHDAGLDTLLLAGRRADVTDLNRLARSYLRHTNQLTGPDVEAPGGRRYAAGDTVITLAPNRAQGLVTSERVRVERVDLGRLDARRSDGRALTLTGDEIDAGHLDHAYAITVHRAQGATSDTTHVYATSGGSRELAYVALSRARQTTYIHAVADNPDQALEDLRSWWGKDGSNGGSLTRPGQPMATLHSASSNVAEHA